MCACVCVVIQSKIKLMLYANKRSYVHVPFLQQASGEEQQTDVGVEDTLRIMM